MTDHARLREQLAFYRELAPAERRALDAHLAGCAECRATLAAYARQDRALAGIPETRARRSRSAWPRPWQAAPPAPARRWLGRLGDGLVALGVAALLWMFALQVQYAQRANEQGGTPANAVAEPGLTLPATRVTPPSPWLPALPYLGGSLLLVGGLFVLSRRGSRWLAVAGGGLAALALITYLPPLSAAPNPLGLYWRLAGGYSYDPQLPFKNQFVIAGRPEAQLAPHLNELIGEVGLSPLDPVQPLTDYEILRVGLHPTHKDVALVTTRFIYADGTSRIYPAPMLEPAAGWNGLWLAGWMEDGLERLRSDHLALPGQPFAKADSPIRLGTAQALSTTSAANRLDEVNPGHWLWTSVRVQRLVWSPTGADFLAAFEQNLGQRQLWRIPLQGPPALLATGDIIEYGWSPDGQTVLYTQRDSSAAEVDPSRPYAVKAMRPVSNGDARTLVTGLASSQLPGLTEQGAWFFNGNDLWVAPYDGGDAALIAADLADFEPKGAPRPSPDGALVLFACGQATCLVEAMQAGESNGTRPVRVLGDFYAAQAAWTLNGSQAAVVDNHPNGVRPVQLVVLSREGLVTLTVPIAPQEATEPPMWTPDNQAVFVQTFPNDGRRLIAVDLATQQVLDLSQEHWDAYYALSPDGTTMLVNNGRGGFWLAEVVRRGD